jgi:hypothetical protein
LRISGAKRAISQTRKHAQCIRLAKGLGRGRPSEEPRSMHADTASQSASPASSRRDLPGAIDSIVARIAHGFAEGDRPTLAELMQLTGDLEEAVLGRRAPSEAIARQISLWYAELPRETATALTTRALAEHARFLLHHGG